MADKRYSVKRWKKNALQAAKMGCGVCSFPNCEVWVGVDLIAQDGNTFAHGHFDVATARDFHARLGEAIEMAERKMLN